MLARPQRSCVLLGADYAGVQTQAAFLRKEWGLCTIKRDDIMKESNSLDTTMRKLSEEIGSFQCRRGFALTHFPATVEEATALDEMISSKHPNKSDYKVFMLDLPSSNEAERKKSSEILNSRARGMLLHPTSGRIYNTTDPELAPQSPNVDDVTGEGLVCPTWNLSDLENRLNDWWNHRRPAITTFFKTRCCCIDASKSRDLVSVEISRTLLGESSTPKELNPAPSAV